MRLADTSAGRQRLLRNLQCLLSARSSLLRGHHRESSHTPRQMIWLPYCHHEYSSNTTRHGKAAIFITDVDGDVLARVRVGARVCSRAAGEIDVIQRAKEKCAVDRQSRDFVIVQAPPLRRMHGIFSPTQLLPQEHSSSFPAKIKHIIVVSWNDEIPSSSQGGTHTMHLLCFTKAFNNSIAAADDAPPSRLDADCI